MPVPLPPALQARSHEESVREEALAARRQSDADRSRALEALCRMAAELVRQHPDPRAALAFQEPISPESERILGRLRERYRRRG